MKFKEFLIELKLEKYLLIFLVIFFILVNCIYKNMSFFKKNIENMSILEDKQITEVLKKYYVSDDFTRSIKNVFQKIQSKGLQITGNIDLTGNVKADGEISNKNISLSDFKIKIDNKVKLLADRQRERERQDELRREEARREQERERQRQAAAANQRHDGCWNPGDTCRCSNTRKQGKCGRGGAKAGIYCQC